MANNLTGECEAVLQISTRLINGVLASLHQNGLDDTAPLKLVHTATVRHGDPPRRLDEVSNFAEWALSYRDTGSRLAETAPPGAALEISRLLTGVAAPPAEVLEDPGPVFRGTARVQLASPTVSVSGSSGTEIIVHVWVRAHYIPDAGTSVLPGPIHGEVKAAFDVRHLPAPGGGARLHVTASTDDGKISFTPAAGSGLNAVEASRLSAEVRKAVRAGFVAPAVDLPSGFPFSHFKGLAAGATHAIALPIPLSTSPPPASAVASVTNAFIGTSGFAFAVSKDAVDGLIDLEGIRTAISSRSLPLRLSRWGISVQVVYRMRFSQGPTLTWSNGAIDVSGRVEIETDTWWAPNGFVSFRQRLTLDLGSSSQAVSLWTAGEPQVNESFFIPHDTAVGIVQAAMTNAVANAATPVRSIFADARTTLTGALRTFDNSSAAAYTAVLITPDGIIVHGEAVGAPRRAPVVAITEQDGAETLSAQSSWIPGGRVERMVWSWVEHQGPTAWSGVTRTVVAEHEFQLPRPAGITDMSNMCLRLEGTHIMADGHAASVAGGGTCLVPAVPSVLEVPSWWQPVTVPVWLPDGAASDAMRLSIAGHVSVQAAGPLDDDVAPNSLVSFPDWRSDQPVASLAQALGQMRRPSGSLLVTLVLPVGAFDSTRREVEAKLLPLTRARIRVVLTEDIEGGWTKTFAASRTPSVFLVNAKRAFAWKHEGEIDPAAMAAALDRHILPAPAPQFRPLRLNVSPGDRALDAVFDDGKGTRVALHRMHGRRVVITFWQPWSEPCVKEVARLARPADKSRANTKVIAVHGGASPEVPEAIAEMHKRHGEGILLAHDANHAITRLYGVRCWPTTITIDETGVIERVQFGHSPAR
jgi:peroxiredoxin